MATATCEADDNMDKRLTCDNNIDCRYGNEEKTSDDYQDQTDSKVGLLKNVQRNECKQ